MDRTSCACPPKKVGIKLVPGSAASNEFWCQHRQSDLGKGRADVFRLAPGPCPRVLALTSLKFLSLNAPLPLLFQPTLSREECGRCWAEHGRQGPFL
jgi:hypothetical protein